MNYHEYYDLESYLFSTVSKRFAEQGFLSAFDFFAIVIWKANRAKSKVARRLLANGYSNLNAAVRDLTEGVYQQANAKERLRYLLKAWKFYLPMATAILTILYPNEFTVYDVRVRELLGLKDVTSSDFERLWQGYEVYKQRVQEATPVDLSLRDKDRYLWGKSAYEQLQSDIQGNFLKTNS